MTPEIFGGIVRAVLAAAGGYFIAKGSIDAGMWATISGAVLTLVTAAWSIWSKSKV
jgi:hypothetical protein